MLSLALPLCCVGTMLSLALLLCPFAGTGVPERQGAVDVFLCQTTGSLRATSRLRCSGVRLNVRIASASAASRLGASTLRLSQSIPTEAAVRSSTERVCTSIALHECCFRGRIDLRFLAVSGMVEAPLNDDGMLASHASRTLTVAEISEEKPELW